MLAPVGLWERKTAKKKRPSGPQCCHIIKTEAPWKVPMRPNKAPRWSIEPPRGPQDGPGGLQEGTQRRPPRWRSRKLRNLRADVWNTAVCVEAPTHLPPCARTHETCILRQTAGTVNHVSSTVFPLRGPLLGASAGALWALLGLSRALLGLSWARRCCGICVCPAPLTTLISTDCANMLINAY